MGLAEGLEFLPQFIIGMHHDEVQVHDQTVLAQLHQLVVAVVRCFPFHGIYRLSPLLRAIAFCCSAQISSV